VNPSDGVKRTSVHVNLITEDAMMK
jgi:hypothetical protein